MPVPIRDDSDLPALPPNALNEVLSSFETLLSSSSAQDPNAQAAALFSRIKYINRVCHAQMKAQKQRTSDARASMDQTHLGLQNLMYERRHLEREIQKCRQFVTIYQEVPLHDLEDFLQLAPEEARTEDVLNDEHQLMLNRLSFELAERQRLDERKKALIAEREKVSKELKDYQNRVEATTAKIEALVKATGEVQSSIQELEV